MNSLVCSLDQENEARTHKVCAGPFTRGEELLICDRCGAEYINTDELINGKDCPVCGNCVICG